ncbi:tRNA pseudouridine(38-40) synthase TruA [Sulfurimonas sp. MAG313]|nr:tRNA pseudouridine(38-40) synthase TruA [Sulfurimonas sp. MAG313]MDF1881392.1 tRNA pseudouridine(38-40) synthase TruA [Sulfurimonas sp. MAG313]
MKRVMYHHRLIVSYKGTNYFGWQDLGQSVDKSTIQGSIQQVLNKICKYQACTVASASRTDAGVHAQGQVVKITIALAIESEKLLLGMNSLLPDDIRVLQCKPCTTSFNPNKDSKSKEYHYYFCTDTVYNPIFNDIITHIPSDNKMGLLDIELMQEACNLFIGEHDFYSFAKRDTKMESTVRIIISCEIMQAEFSIFGNNIYYLKVVGEGFLRHMVRYIAGALFALGKKQLSLSDINEALTQHKEEKVSARAKSKGLHLICISY